MRFRRFWIFITLILWAGCQSGVNSGNAILEPGVNRSVLATGTPLLSTITTSPIYGDQLAVGWSVDRSWGLDYDLEAKGNVHGGQYAIAVSPHMDDAELLFSTRVDSDIYDQFHLLGIRFWLSVDAPLDMNSLSLVLVEDIPLQGTAASAVSTRTVAVPLTSLGIGDLQPFQWTLVEFWLSKFSDAALPRYFRGFYLQSSGEQWVSFRVDDIELMVLRDTVAPILLEVKNPELDQVVLYFSKDVNPYLVANPAVYHISVRGNGKDESMGVATIDYSPLRREALLHLAEPLHAGETYQVDMEGLADLASPPNLLVSEPMTFTAGTLMVLIEAGQPTHSISPYVYGVSGLDPEYIGDLRPGLISWGGNPSSRYNWKLGNAWSAARDWQYKNGTYDYQGASASDDFVRRNREWGIGTRLAVPTLGWVARDTSSCSFPQADGSCGNAGNATCDHPGPIADPSQSSVAAPPEFVAEWITHLVTDVQGDLTFVAMDNEPELWGVTHYDVHPTCTTYDEILERFVSYGEAVKAVSPQSKIVGPVTCCWAFYWSTLGGTVDKIAHGGEDFLPWFLKEMAEYETRTGTRLLDYLDIHYYPEGFYSDDVQPVVAEGRLRSTRSLWDKSFNDESWINQPIYLIPRMKEMIAKYYPGTGFGISEWNWGADKTMNGALAIGDVLGILGRENVDYAAYWRYPEPGSAGYNAFKLYTNYDGQGGRFGNISVPAFSSNSNLISVYSTLDEKQENLYVMLVHKGLERPMTILVQVKGVLPGSKGRWYRLDQMQSQQITSGELATGSQFDLELSPYSITLLVLPLEAQ